MKRLVPRNEKRDGNKNDKNDNPFNLPRNEKRDGNKNDKNDNPFNLPPYVRVPDFEDLDFEKLVDADGRYKNPVYAYNPEYCNADFIKYLYKKEALEDFSDDEALFWLQLSNYQEDAQLIRKIQRRLYKLGLLKFESYSDANLDHDFIWIEESNTWFDKITGKTIDELFKEC